MYYITKTKEPESLERNKRFIVIFYLLISNLRVDILIPNKYKILSEALRSF
jgi:hypothetical protein